MQESPPIQIFGEEELVARLAAGGQVYSHLVSIADPGSPMPEEFKLAFERILRLEFNDLESETDRVGAEDRLPGPEDLRLLAGFVDRTRAKATGYTIHCWHGKGRSPAIAAAIIARCAASAEGAVAAVESIAPGSRPNKRVLGLIDGMLALPVATSQAAPR